MANPAKTPDQTLGEAQAMLDQTKAQGSTAFKGSSYDTSKGSTGSTGGGGVKNDTTINSSTITPTTPIVPVQGTAPSNSAALAGTIESQSKQYAETVVSDAKLKAAEAAKKTSYDALYNKITDTRGKTGYEDQLYQDLGVDDKEKTLTKINDDILAEENSFNRRKEAIEKNSRGATQSFIDGEVRAAEKESLAKRADLSVIKSVAQNDYYGAKAIADRKVAALLEDDAQEIKLLEMTYLDNKDLFTKAEQRQFEAQQNERTRLLQDRATELKAVNDLAINALQNGAPVDVVRQMQEATSQADAIGIGGSWVGKLDRDTQLLQQQKIRSDMNAAANAAAAAQQQAAMIQQLSSNGDPVSSKQALSTILSSDAVSTGTKGRIAPALGVINAVDEFANSNIEGEFTGVGIFGRIKEGVKGFFNKKSPEAINNAQNIEAVNLRVQQWASGAALTEAQTQQVNRLTPTLNDSDATVRTKLSGLYNFMLNQAEADLLTDGVNIQFQPVNLFEIRDLYQKASPEQKKLIEEKYFKKTGGGGSF